jgi:hypothetical protein
MEVIPEKAIWVRDTFYGPPLSQVTRKWRTLFVSQAPG